MVIFGPYNIAPIGDDSFMIFNLSSPAMAVPRERGLLVTPPIEILDSPEAEKEFDKWYYNYVFSNEEAFSSLMSILYALKLEKNVYICTVTYDYGLIDSINESFMKILQTRYGIKYSIVNSKEDFDYIDKDGCDFDSVRGIKTFDEDIARYNKLIQSHCL